MALKMCASLGTSFTESPLKFKYINLENSVLMFGGDVNTGNKGLMKKALAYFDTI